MIMGYYSGNQVQLDAVELIIGGEFTLLFVGFVIVLGLIVPAVIEFFELFGLRIPVIIPVLLTLIGGLIFRFVMVDAGQISSFVY